METPFNNTHSSPLPNSLWAATTCRIEGFPELHGDQVADVVVIGGGFMGLSAALNLAENGVDVALIEAAEIGWGASGRNNGLVAPGLKRDPDEVRRILGKERGDNLLRFSGNAPAVVFDLIEKHAINCDVNRCGWIQAAHSRRALPRIETRVSQWRNLGADVELIPADRVTDRLGSKFYAGAWFDPRGGSINPLAYVRGLAVAAYKAGVRIYEGSPVVDIAKSSGRWAIEVPGGSVRCDQVICCTNAYSDWVSQLRGTVIPLRTAQVASAPLAPEQCQDILPGGESASDTQRLLTSFRITADNRLIMGGASATAGDENPELMSYLHKAAHERFPQLGTIRWEFGWSGYLALTHNHLPQVFRVDDGFYAGIGCNGRGIAMATVTGMSIADLVCGLNDTSCKVPVGKPKRIAGFGLRHAGVAIGVKFNRILDRAEHRIGG